MLSWLLDLQRHSEWGHPRHRVRADLLRWVWVAHLELSEKLTAVPQDALDLLNPQQSEVLGKSQGHVPYLQAARSTAP